MRLHRTTKNSLLQLKKFLYNIYENKKSLRYTAHKNVNKKRCTNTQNKSIKKLLRHIKINIIK